MKSLGVENLLQIKQKNLGITGRWLALLGNVPPAFEMIAYGPPGSGKTALLLQLCKELAKFGKVEYWSYEEGVRLRNAVEREGMADVAGRFLLVDPFAKLKEGQSLWDELATAMGKRGSALVWVIDSVSYAEFTYDQCKRLKQKYGHKKIIIWTCHSKGEKPDTAVGEKINKYGDIGLYVRKQIAYPLKSRYSATEPMVIWEEKAKQLNPLFFSAKKDAQKIKTKRPKKTRKKIVKKQ